MDIKVLFIGMTPNPGGLETYMINIFSRLQNKGFSFSFVNVSNKDIAYSKYIKNNGGKIYDIPLNGGIKNYVTRYYIVKRFFKYHHNFDIVHINALSVNEVYWAKAAHKYNINRVIIQSHNSNAIHNSKIISFCSKIMGFLNKKFLSNCNFITRLAVSYKSGQWMFGNNAKFKVLCNGINVNNFIYNNNCKIKLKKLLRISNDKIIITTARISKQKNYPKIVGIFREIHKLMPNTKLVIIGNGPGFKYIYNLVDQYKLSNSVVFLGKRSKKEIPKFLCMADLMLMPSFFEGYPYSLLEAQAAGVPALVSAKVIPKESNITGYLKYISLNKSDYYWATQAIKILSNKLNKNDKIYMNQLVEKSKYNIDNSIKQIKTIYTQLIK